MNVNKQPLIRKPIHPVTGIKYEIKKPQTRLINIGNAVLQNDSLKNLDIFIPKFLYKIISIPIVLTAYAIKTDIHMPVAPNGLAISIAPIKLHAAIMTNTTANFFT